MEAALAKAPRCTLVNLSTGEESQVLFNPEQLVEELQVNWSRLTVPGLSHQVLQFQSTGNRQLSGVEFYFDRYYANSQPGGYDIDDFRKFMRALCFPSEAAKGVAATAPPRVLVVWPGVLSAECVVSSLKFTHKKFAAEGGSILIYTATVTFEEIMDTRLTSEEARRDA